MGRKMYMTVYSIPFICRCSAKLEPSSCLWWTNGLEVVVERWWLFLLLQRSAPGGPRAAGVVGLDGGGALEFDAIGCMAIWSCCISVRWAKHCWRRSSRAWRNNCHDCWRCYKRCVSAVMGSLSSLFVTTVPHRDDRSEGSKTQLENESLGQFLNHQRWENGWIVVDELVCRWS
jgi:hypothetical protein